MKTAKILAVSLALCLCTGCGSGGFPTRETQFGNVAIGGGGYIPGIVYSKAEPGLRYCRTDIGGAYRQSARDAQWTPITDHLGGVNSGDWNLIGIEALAADPCDPARVYLACGTYAGTNGAILASDDYGETWHQCDMPFGMGGNQSGRGVGERLLVDPNANSRVFYGSRADGLWQSDDFGLTWWKNESFPVCGDYFQEKNQIGVMWVEADPASADLYVGVAMQDGCCIYRTSDGGRSFTALPARRPGMFPLRADISPNGQMYLAYADSCGPNAQVKDGAVDRYDLKNGVFTEITPDCNDYRYGGFSGIAVDPQDPDTIVCGTLGFWSEKGENIYRSTDGGDSWTPLFSNDGDNYVMDVSEAQWLNWGRETAQTGWWMADLEFDPFNRDVITYGTGATLYSTTNLTALGSGTPVTVAFDAKGIEETAVFKVVSAPAENGAPALYSIMGDLTGFAHLDPDVRPDDAHFMNNGVASDLAVAWQNGKVAAYTHNSKRAPITYTIDGGATWQAAAGIPAAIENGTVALNADGSVLIWAPGPLSDKVYYTKDWGAHWYVCGGIGRGAVVCGDKREANVFYAVAGEKIYVSHDSGVKFEPTGLSVGDHYEIVPSDEAPGAVWIRSGASVGFSKDYAASVEYIPNLSAIAIGVGCAEKPGGAMPLYILGYTQKPKDMAATAGVFMTADHGKHVSLLSGEKERFGNITPSITGDASVFGRFYFATNGRGIIMGDMQG